MTEYEVTCVTMSLPYGGHEHITEIGGPTENGWKLSKRDAIQAIDSKQKGFYTVDKTTYRRVYVGVVRGDGNKAPYLRTHADGKWNDNLLAMTACPINYRLVNAYY